MKLAILKAFYGYLQNNPALTAEIGSAKIYTGKASDDALYPYAIINEVTANSPNKTPRIEQDFYFQVAFISNKKSEALAAQEIVFNEVTSGTIVFSPTGLNVSRFNHIYDSSFMESEERTQIFHEISTYRLTANL